MFGFNRASSYQRPLKLGVIAAAIVLAMAGCVKFPGESDKPPRLYVLTPKKEFAKNLPNVKWQLLVETPVAAAGLSTARIALQDSPIQLRYFQHATWTDFAPKMVQALIIESFEDSGRIVSVGREQIGLRADFVMKSELREFQAEYENVLPEDATLGPKDKPPWVRVRIGAKLVKMPQREIVAARIFEHRVRSKSNTMIEIIRAFNGASGKVLKSLVEWALKTGEKHQSKRRFSRN
jgi:cholesterol transport system auxiliary component